MLWCGVPRAGRGLRESWGGGTGSLTASRQVPSQEASRGRWGLLRCPCTGSDVTPSISQEKSSERIAVLTSRPFWCLSRVPGPSDHSRLCNGLRRCGSSKRRAGCAMKSQRRLCCCGRFLEALRFTETARRSLAVCSSSLDCTPFDLPSFRPSHCCSLILRSSPSELPALNPCLSLLWGEPKIKIVSLVIV